VTIVGDIDVKLNALEAGANDFLIRPLDHLETAARCKNALVLRRHQIASNNYTKDLEFRVEKATQEVRLSEMETLWRLAKVAEQRDSITGLHLTRMSKYSALLARECGWGKDDQYAMEISSPLHDIGKIGIPDAILQTPRRLTPEEWVVMKQHAEIGYQMLSGSQSRFLKIAAEIARGHHEKFDGSGYPSNLAGEMIPLEARIVAIADVYDALTSVRQYKPAWTLKETHDHMRAQSGKHFDPELLDIFLKCTDEIEHISRAFADPN
jgi:response regulator RpfG family c-di-GMP phosphodiesterase